MAEPTGLFLADAEENDTAEWTTVTPGAGCTIAAAAAAKLHGNYGFDFQWPGGVAASYCFKTLGSTYDELYFRCYIQFDTASDVTGTDIVGMMLEESGTERAKVIFYANGAGNGLGYTVACGGGSLYSRYNEEVFAQDTPYCIELRWRNETAGGAGAGGIEIWIDGVSAYSNYTQSNGSGKGNRLFIGNRSLSACAAGTRVFYDDVKMDSSYIGLYPAEGMVLNLKARAID